MDNTFTISQYPKEVGGYNLGGVTLMLGHKPLAVHRLMVKLLLGWEWEDNK